MGGRNFALYHWAPTERRKQIIRYGLREMSHGQHAEGVSLALSFLNEYQQEKKQ